jgi:hypothetical protein
MGWGESRLAFRRIDETNLVGFKSEIERQKLAQAPSGSYPAPAVFRKTKALRSLNFLGTKQRLQAAGLVVSGETHAPNMDLAIGEKKARNGLGNHDAELMLERRRWSETR